MDTYDVEHAGPHRDLPASLPDLPFAVDLAPTREQADQLRRDMLASHDAQSLLADRDQLRAEVAGLRRERDVLLREAEVADLIHSRLSHALLNAALFLRDDTPGPMREAIQSALDSYADPGSVVPAAAMFRADQEAEAKWKRSMQIRAGNRTASVPAGEDGHVE